MLNIIVPNIEPWDEIHQIHRTCSNLNQTCYLYYLFEHTVCDLLNRSICNKRNHYLTHMQRVFQSIYHAVCNQRLLKSELIPLLQKIFFRFSLHSCIIFITTCWIFCDFLHATKKVKDFYYREQSFLKTYHKFFEKVFKILTGWKFEIESLFSVFLYRGFTQATLALTGKNIIFKTIVYRYWKWCTQRLCGNFD